MSFGNAAFDRAYDEWKLSEPQADTELVTTKGVFETDMGLKIEVKVRFFWSKKYGPFEVDSIQYFFRGNKLDFDHPITDKYDRELSRFIKDLTKEYRG